VLAHQEKGSELNPQYGLKKKTLRQRDAEDDDIKTQRERPSTGTEREEATLMTPYPALLKWAVQIRRQEPSYCWQCQRLRTGPSKPEAYRAVTQETETMAPSLPSQTLTQE
jgi:hypothetical protein